MVLPNAFRRSTRIPLCMPVHFPSPGLARVGREILGMFNGYEFA